MNPAKLPAPECPVFLTILPANSSSTNSVLVIGNSAGSNDLAEFVFGAVNAAGPIASPSSVDNNTIPTANFNL